MVSLAPNKFLTPDFKHLTATSFTFVRYSSGESHEQLSSADHKNVSVDTTEEVIPDAPEVPVETPGSEQVEIFLVLIMTNSLDVYFRKYLPKY